MPFAGAKWPVVVVVVLVFGFGGAVLVRARAGFVPGNQWEAARGLARWVKAGLLGAGAAGVVLAVCAVVPLSKDGQAHEVRDGRYYVSDKDRSGKVVVREVSRRTYEDVQEGGLRFMFGVSGFMLAGMSFAVLVAGEARRSGAVSVRAAG
ncbi:hypothetical protein [Yinghuangia soli]|uniref:Uncharacterized protein n=1 Tax=Yinghuangia soli TaxID=2908204 RepID=A0AA41Q4H7_9ACTN|nr:hypothetical protein [Yinghuangia soli]MCF2531394.1 hypothetical protein [Yinghuangia soli]